jgi:membrane protein implicated in regulation of membrane protease activity
MLTLYWICFTVGGVFVLLAIAGGHSLDFGDHDVDWQHDLESSPADLPSELGGEPGDADLDWSVPSDRTPTPRPNFLLRSVFGVFQSLKFWTFGACFLGLTGLVLSHLTIALSPVLVAIAAVSMGLICGTLMSGSLQLLRHRHTDSLIRTTDLAGQNGTVELPFNVNSRGKVRLVVKGSSISFMAYTDEQRDFQPGDRVLVVGTENNRLWVVSAEKYDP